jgi:hypothetical protein
VLLLLWLQSVKTQQSTKSIHLTTSEALASF